MINLTKSATDNYTPDDLTLIPPPSHRARTARELGEWLQRRGRIRGKFPVAVEVVDAVNHYGSVKLRVRMIDRRQRDQDQWVMSSGIEWDFPTLDGHQ